MNFNFPIETARLKIRPYTASDINEQTDAVLESVNTVGRWLPWCKPNYSVKDAAEWFVICADAMAEFSAFTFGLFDKSTEQLIGSITINQLQPDMAIGNIGYWIRESKQGLGYASEAVLAIKHFGFVELKLLRLEIVAAVDNIASNRVALKAGAKFEHVDTKRIKLATGYVDANIYGFFAFKEQKNNPVIDPVEL